ncbi:MAG: anthranilate synthase component II [Flavobacteriales bacterium]
MTRNYAGISHLCIIQRKTMRILLIDNYDSFTWNLQHLLVSEGAHVDVYRNDEVFPAGAVHYDGLVLSPGPGLPEEAGHLMRIITVASAHRIPVLAVCLGMQAMAEHFGATLRNLDEVLHGQSTELTQVISEGIFRGIEAPCEVGHYHSWVVDELDFPRNLEITARNAAGLPLAMRHRSLPMEAVQFHPESVLTPSGPRMVRNWLEDARAFRLAHPVEPSMAPVRMPKPDEDWSDLEDE